jgi:hypothetical protein
MRPSQFSPRTIDTEPRTAPKIFLKNLLALPRQSADRPICDEKAVLKSHKCSILQQPKKDGRAWTPVFG